MVESPSAKYQIASIRPNQLAWGRDHLHLSGGYRGDQNTFAAASPHLDLRSDDHQRGAAGWGVFPRFDQLLVLTDLNGTGVSQWRLPRWFYPDGNKLPLTYHGNVQKRWRRDARHAYLEKRRQGAGIRPRTRSLPRGRRVVG